MLEGTIAVPLEDLARANGHLTGQPMCPACKFGYLHPYKVSTRLPNAYVGGWHGADMLVGWVMVCVGNRMYLRESAKTRTDAESAPDDNDGESAACGFTMPVTAYRWDRESRRPVPAT